MEISSISVQFVESLKEPVHCHLSQRKSCHRYNVYVRLVMNSCREAIKASHFGILAGFSSTAIKIIRSILMSDECFLLID